MIPFFLLLRVLLNQISSSKYNELRLNKATTPPQHRNKEVGKWNKRHMQCTRQGMILLTTVFTMVFYLQQECDIVFSLFYVESQYSTPVQSDVLSRVKIKCKIAQLFFFHMFQDFDRCENYSTRYQVLDGSSTWYRYHHTSTIKFSSLFVVCHAL